MKVDTSLRLLPSLMIVAVIPSDSDFKKQAAAPGATLLLNPEPSVSRSVRKMQISFLSANCVGYALSSRLSLACIDAVSPSQSFEDKIYCRSHFTAVVSEAHGKDADAPSRQMTRIGVTVQNMVDDRTKEQAVGNACVTDDLGVTVLEDCFHFFPTSCRDACSLMSHMASNVAQLPFWLQLPFLLSSLPQAGNLLGLVTMAMVLVSIGGTCLKTSRHRKDGSGRRPFEQNEAHEDTRSSAHDNHNRKKKKKVLHFGWRRQAGTDHARLKAVEDLTRMWSCKPHSFEHAIEVMARIIECKYISPAEFSESPLVSEIWCTLQKHDHETKMGKTTSINLSFMQRVGEFFAVVSMFAGQDSETQHRNPKMMRKPLKSARRGFREEEERVRLGNNHLLWVPCVFLVVAVAMLLVPSLTPTVARARLSSHSSMPALTCAPTVTFTGSASAGLVTYVPQSRVVSQPTTAAGVVVVIFGIVDNGLVNEWNNKTVEITGFRKDAVVGQSLVNEKSVTEVRARTLEGKEEVIFGLPIFTKDQKRMEVLLQPTTRSGNEVGAIGGGQDVTKRKQVQMEMIRMAKQLKSHGVQLLNSFINTENALISGAKLYGDKDRMVRWYPKMRAGGGNWSALLSALWVLVAVYVVRHLLEQDLFPAQGGATALRGAARRRGGMGGALRLNRKNVSKVLLVLALCLGSAIAAPWSRTFGGCTFSVDRSGAPLELSGSCPTQSGPLCLNNKSITLVKNNSFHGMGACR